jgi:hypothetical protein
MSIVKTTTLGAMTDEAKEQLDNDMYWALQLAIAAADGVAMGSEKRERTGWAAMRVVAHLMSVMTEVELRQLCAKVAVQRYN